MDFLIRSGFIRGLVDPNLFRCSNEKHLMLVQICVDDIIFGSIDPSLVTDFANLLTKKFEMNMNRELSFFLELQVHQSSLGISIHQEKYATQLLRIFKMDNCAAAKVLMPSVTKFKVTPLVNLSISGLQISQLGIEETKLHCTLHCRSRIHCCVQFYFSSLWMQCQLRDYRYRYQQIPISRFLGDRRTMIGQTLECQHLMLNRYYSGVFIWIQIDPDNTHWNFPINSPCDLSRQIIYAILEFIPHFSQSSSSSSSSS